MPNEDTRELDEVMDNAQGSILALLRRHSMEDESESSLHSRNLKNENRGAYDRMYNAWVNWVYEVVEEYDEDAVWSEIDSQMGFRDAILKLAAAISSESNRVSARDYTQNLLDDMEIGVREEKIESAAKTAIHEVSYVGDGVKGGYNLEYACPKDGEMANVLLERQVEENWDLESTSIDSGCALLVKSLDF